MGDRGITESEVLRFIFENIDTVPHMEALLQLWESRPRQWPAEELAHRLFISPDVLSRIIQDLSRVQLVSSGEEHGTRWYAYHSVDPATDDLVEAVAATYRRDLLRITASIHAKAASGAREFGRAFKFKKGED